MKYIDSSCSIIPRFEMNVGESLAFAIDLKEDRRKFDMSKFKSKNLVPEKE